MMRGYPKWFYKLLLNLLLLLFISGCLLAPTVFDLKLEWNMPWRLNDNMRLWVAAIHAMLSFLSLALLGSLWAVHMRMGWKRRKNQRSGLLVVSLMLLLLLTAIGIYYFGDEQLATLASVIHLAIGAGAPLLLIYHIWSGRRKALQA